MHMVMNVSHSPGQPSRDFSWQTLLSSEVGGEELGQAAWPAATVTLDLGTKAAARPLCWKWRISMGCNLPCGQD